MRNWHTYLIVAGAAAAALAIGLGAQASPGQHHATLQAWLGSTAL
jgi:hypothetical protein